MAISDDGGKTWTASQPLAGFGSIQPAVLERKDGTLVAYMRENGAASRRSASRESKDGGVTWGTVGVTDLPNPGSRPRRGAPGERQLAARLQRHASRAATASRCRSPTTRARRGSGRGTWRSTTTGSYHYPAVIQAKDGSIHAVYSYFVTDGKSMKHARFNEAWVKEGTTSRSAS